MVKENTKNIILQKGAAIIHERGYNNTGIQEICKAANIPKGSFYYYFKNKEDFAGQLIDFFAEYFFSKLEQYYQDDNDPYIERLRKFFVDYLEFFRNNNYRGGCPLGNLAQELSDTNEILRTKIEGVFEDTGEKILRFLEEAQKNGEISPEIDPGEMSEFTFNSWQGALLRMKVSKSPASYLIFEKKIFDVLFKL